MGNLIPKFVDLVKGNYSKRFLICILIPIMIGVMILFYTLAIISFPNYNWTLHQISELGDPTFCGKPNRVVLLGHRNDLGRNLFNSFSSVHL